MTSKISMTTRIAAAAIAVVAGLAAPQARADVQTTGCSGGSFGAACGLDELLAGGTMTVDGVRFSNFTLGLNGGTLLAASSIRVDAIDIAAGPGFSFFDAANALRAVNGGLSSNDLGFDITSVAGGPVLTGANLAVAVGDINGTGSYTNAFADLFNPAFTSYLGGLTASCDGPACSNTTQAATASFAGVSAMSVVAGLDIGAAAGGMAQVNGFSMTVAAAVPEPATWASLGAGLAVIGLLRRRVGSTRAA